MSKPAVGRLCVITDTTARPGLTHLWIAERAIAGGADMIQLRDKILPTSEIAAIARDVKTVCATGGALLIVNDHADIAADIADGVHVGQDDAPIASARAQLGPDRIVGGSAGTLDQALAVQAAGADYVGFGHIFPTASKLKPEAPVGIDDLALVCENVDIPVIAIGGINIENIDQVMAAGAWGVAVIAAVSSARDPSEATTALRERIDLR